MGDYYRQPPSQRREATWAADTEGIRRASYRYRLKSVESGSEEGDATASEGYSDEDYGIYTDDTESDEDDSSSPRNGDISNSQFRRRWDRKFDFARGHIRRTQLTNRVNMPELPNIIPNPLLDDVDEDSGSESDEAEGSKDDEDGENTEDEAQRDDGARSQEAEEDGDGEDFSSRMEALKILGDRSRSRLSGNNLSAIHRKETHSLRSQIKLAPSILESQGSVNMTISRDNTIEDRARHANLFAYYGKKSQQNGCSDRLDDHFS